MGKRLEVGMRLNDDDYFLNVIREGLQDRVKDIIERAKDEVLAGEYRAAVDSYEVRHPAALPRTLPTLFFPRSNLATL
eukprot:95829-Rhodomonas_salina.1